MKGIFFRRVMLLVIGAGIFLSACRNRNERMVYPAFYYWKTTFAISGFESDYLKALSARTLYLRFFDVDWDAATLQPVPLAETDIKTGVPDSLEIVPVIFITNRIFVHLSREDIPGLADKVLKKIIDLSSNFPDHPINEIQFDCDWTSQTRAKYFEFLEATQSILPDKTMSLSSTIRLHQIKFFQTTGVPPVDRAVLMFYNMGNVEDVNAENSILDLAIARQYLENVKEYPLQFDVALPLFSWGVLIREGKMINLINNLTGKDLEDELRFLKIGECRFELIKSTYLQGYYLYKGDVIRLESAPHGLLLESAAWLNKVLPERDLKVIFYHLDSVVINNYSHETLEAVGDRFR